MKNTKKSNLPKRPIVGKRYVWYYHREYPDCWCYITPLYYHDEHGVVLCKGWSSHAGERLSLTKIDRLEKDMGLGWIVE